MSNQNTELQKTEKAFLERFSGNHSFDVSVKILGGLSAMVTILTGIVYVISFVYSLSVFAYLPLISVVGALVCVISGLAYYFISLRPRNKRLAAENESLKTELEPLKTEHQKQLDALKEGSENETETIKASLSDTLTNVQTAVKINDERIAKLNEIGWLIELAEKQAKTISTYVIAEEVKYSNHDFEGRSHYKVIFVIRVSNKSVFNIAFENSIGGWLKFNHEPFLGEKRFAETPPTIKPFETGFIRIEQRLSSTEVEMLERAMQKYENDSENYKSGGIPVASQIDLYDLIITVKANEKFPTVLSKPLHTFNLSFDVTKKEFNL